MLRLFGRTLTHRFGNHSECIFIYGPLSRSTRRGSFVHPRERVEQLMQAPAEPTDETKHSRGFGSYVFWAGLVLVLYALSIGLYAMLIPKRVSKGRPLLLTNLFAP